MMRIGAWSITILAGIVLLYLPVHAQEKEWNQLIQAAKQEGRIVVAGSSDPELRKRLPVKFKQRFGIVMEYLAVRMRDLVSRMQAERRSGHYTVDAILSSTGSVIRLYSGKMIRPIRPLLIEEVVQPSKWQGGKLRFNDPEQRYVVRFNNSLNPLFMFNTRFLKREEIHSIKEFIKPKWKGKIALPDPRSSTHSVPVALYLSQGEEFIKKLYVDNQPTFSAQRRQLADWLIRGTYPITIGVRDQAFDRLRAEGFPIDTVLSLPDFPGFVVSGSGNLSILDGAPHPNAARLFANWLLSKEGLEYYTRIRHEPTLRTDIDKSLYTSQFIPKPGVKYLDGGSFEFGKTRRAVSKKIARIISAQR